MAGGAAGDEPRPPGDAGRGAGDHTQEARDLQVRPHAEEDEGQGGSGPGRHHRGDQCGCVRVSNKTVELLVIRKIDINTVPCIMYNLSKYHILSIHRLFL